MRTREREREEERVQFTELHNGQSKSTFSNIGEFIHANKADDLIPFSFRPPTRLLPLYTRASSLFSLLASPGTIKTRENCLPKETTS